MKPFVRTGLALAAASGLGAYIYFVDSERPATGLEPKEKVFAVESATIEELRVTAQGETTVLVKKDGGWQITEPTQADADATETSSQRRVAVALGPLEQILLHRLEHRDDALGLTGLVITKLDGTAKGGALLAIAQSRPVPVLFIGVGEGIDDLRPFVAADFAEALVD